MEDYKGESGKYIVMGLLAGALAAALSSYIPFAAAVMPALIAFVIAAWGNVGTVSAILGAAAVTLFLNTPEDAAYIASLYLPSSIVIGIIIRKKLPWRTAVCVSALLLSVALYLSITLPSILAGEEPFAAITKEAEAFGEYINSNASLANLDEDTVKSLKATVLLIKELMPRVTMYFVCGFGMAAALIDVLIARMLCKKAKLALRPMTHFALWQLSKQYSYISLAALAGALVALLTKLDNADAVFSAAATVVLAPMMLMGASSLEFLLRMKSPGNAGKRLLYYLLAILLLPYSFIFLGIMDRVTKVRRHYRQKSTKEDKDGKNGGGGSSGNDSEREEQDGTEKK